MSYLRHSRDIENIKPRVSYCLGKYQASIIPDRALECLGVSGVYKCRLNAETGQGVGHQVMAAPIKCSRCNNVRSRTHQRHNGQMKGGLAASRCYCADTILKCGDSFFQHRVGWVAQARVDVSRALNIEQGSGVIRIRETERRGLVNWCRSGTRRGIRLRPCVECEGVEFRVVGSCHASLLGTR